MKAKECTDVSQKLMELILRTYYTYRDETRDEGEVSVGSHAFGVMMKIYYSDKFYSVNELSALMHMHNPQLSKILNGLEDNGLVDRRRPRENRRSVEIRLTDEGKAYVEKMSAIMQQRIEAALSDKELADASAVTKALDQLYTALYIK